MLKAIRETVEEIRKRIDTDPEIGVILGTGLNSVAELIKEPVVISYQDLPNMSASTAPSHLGRFIIGELNGRQTIIMQGRLHFYEGYSMQQITFPVRLMQVLGVKILIVTNAAGSLTEKLQPGDLVLIDDHINFMGTNPLIGEDQPELGERFPSMNQPYSSRLIELAKQIALEHGFTVKSGVYTGLQGPSLETKAECRMFARLGSELVGMSTVPEVIVAVQAGMEVLGISVVTNLSNLFHNRPHSQEEIRQNALKAKDNLKTIILNVIEKQ